MFPALICSSSGITVDTTIGTFFVRITIDTTIGIFFCAYYTPKKIYQLLYTVSPDDEQISAGNM
jgi:hypothetical protein